MCELEKVNVGVGRDVGCCPTKLTCTRGRTVDASSDRVELGHVLVGSGHELDLHALPCLVGGGVPLDRERSAFVGAAGGERRRSRRRRGIGSLSLDEAGHGDNRRDAGQGSEGPRSERSSEELHFDCGARVRSRG